MLQNHISQHSDSNNNQINPSAKHYFSNREDFNKKISSKYTPRQYEESFARYRSELPLRARILFNHLTWQLEIDRNQMTIAELSSVCGYSERQVQRYIRKFHEDAIFTSGQYHQRSPNYFTFAQSPHIVVKKENVTLIKSSSLLTYSNLLTNSYLKNINLESLTRVRAKAQDKIHKRKEEFKEKKFRNKKEIAVLSLELKEILHKNENNPKLHEIIETDRFRRAIFTKIMRTCVRSFSMNKIDSLKLIALPDEAIESAFFQIHKNHATSTKKVSLLIYAARQYCKEKNLETDWGSFYWLCRLFKIDAKAEIKRRRDLSKEYAAYAPWKSKTAEEDINKRAQIRMAAPKREIYNSVVKNNPFTQFLPKHFN